MRINREHRPDKLGVVVAELPVKRDREDVTEGRVYGFKRKTGADRAVIVARFPVELNAEDDCEKPMGYFSGQALQIARGESGEPFLTVPVTKDGVKTLEAEFEIHDVDPNEGVPTVAGLNECFPEVLPEAVIGVNVAALKRAADAIGAAVVALFVLEDGRLVIREAGDVDEHRPAEAVLARVPIVRQPSLDFGDTTEGTEGTEES